MNKGWTHAMVRHEMVSFYALVNYGQAWNQPTDKQLLEIAAQQAA